MGLSSFFINTIIMKNNNKHILVPIDFSDVSLHALEHAILLANKLLYNIRLINVKRKNADYSSLFTLNDFDEVLKSGITEQFENIIDTYKNVLHGEFDYKIRDGRIYTEICNQAKYADAEFIVMGTNGVSGFEEMWSGSNAFRVASNSVCPVVTVRTIFSLQSIRKIVVPIDRSLESRQKVPFMAQMAKLFDAELHILAVRETNKKSVVNKLNGYINEIKQYLDRRNINCIYEEMYGHNNTQTTIEYALMTDSDLIAIMTEQSQKTDSFWLGPYAQQMVNHSPIPVISFKPQ